MHADIAAKPRHIGRVAPDGFDPVAHERIVFLRAPGRCGSVAAPEHRIVERRAEPGRHAKPGNSKRRGDTGQRQKLLRRGKSGAVDDHRKRIAAQNARERHRIEVRRVAPLVEGAAEHGILGPALSAPAIGNDGKARAIMRPRDRRDGGGVLGIGERGDEVADREFSRAARQRRRLARRAETARPIGGARGAGVRTGLEP